jgi:nucleoside-diphosphate-sugar epimerase
LQRIAASTGLELVIVRPPLVYGPGVKANFEGMMKWLHKGIPLPLGAIDNRRSLVFIDNLVDLLMCCIRHPGAAGGVFLVSDGEDLSTTELLQRVTSHLGIPNRLLPIPIKLVNTCAGIFGRIDLAQRLCDSLQVSIAHTEEILKWKPPFSVEHGLIKTADAYLRKRI